MDEIGVIHGRFQVLHNDHMKYLLAGKNLCKHLVIGICNPEIELTKYTASNPHRSKKSSNPMTFFERLECIRNALIEVGIPRDEFEIVPFPINFPERLFNYVPLSATFYMTIYDEWGAEKYKMLKEELNLNVKVMWNVPIGEKGISASDIRSYIYQDKDLKDMVPNSVYKYIKENQIDKRIKSYLMNEKGENL